MPQTYPALTKNMIDICNSNCEIETKLLLSNCFFHVIINKFSNCFSYQKERAGRGNTRRECLPSLPCKVSVQATTGGIAMEDTSTRWWGETSSRETTMGEYFCVGGYMIPGGRCRIAMGGTIVRWCVETSYGKTTMEEFFLCVGGTYCRGEMLLLETSCLRGLGVAWGEILCLAVRWQYCWVDNAP